MINSNYTIALAAGLVSALSIGAVMPSHAQNEPRDYRRTAPTAMKEGKWLSQLIQKRKLDMSMPGSAPGDTAAQIEPALIRVIKDGTIYWGTDNSLMIDNDMNNSNLSTLVQQLEAKKQEASAVGTEPVVLMRVEREVPHQRVIDVMKALREAGVTTVALTGLKNE